MYIVYMYSVQRTWTCTVYMYILYFVFDLIDTVSYLTTEEKTWLPTEKEAV